MNPAWKAIGYTGLAPEVRSRTEEEYQRERPLGDGHISGKQASEKLKQSLTSKGFHVVDGPISDFDTPVEVESTNDDVYVECDAVVVGSGSGGGVMAAALAKHGFRVLVLEKGQYFAAQDITALEGPGMVNLYEKMGCMATDDGGVELIAGKSVGGGNRQHLFTHDASFCDH